MFSLILRSYLKIKNKKKFSKIVKKTSIQNHRNFYIFLNYHTQHRSGYNMTRPYLLNTKLWYFQKKQLFQPPLTYKKINIDVVHDYTIFSKLDSKLNDFIKKIF